MSNRKKKKGVKYTRRLLYGNPIVFKKKKEDTGVISVVL